LQNLQNHKVVVLPNYIIISKANTIASSIVTIVLLNVKIQNVELQNVEIQNVELQNVE
jgi:hypothetical protein